MSTTEYLRKILEEQEATRRLLDPYGINDIGGRGILPSDPPYSVMMMQQRADEARKLWEIQFEYQLTLERAAYQERQLTSFRIAQIDEANRLASEAMFANSEYSKLLQSIDLQARMRDMHQPWLGRDLGKSALAFTEIQAIGIGLNTRPPFEPEFTSVIREPLGDWRHTFEPPLERLLDPALRSDLYIERGFNPALAEFPEPAFVESAGLAGLDVWPEASADSGEDEQDDAEKRFRRNVAAFDRLQRFETELREFVETTMQRVFGDNWIKQQTKEGMLDAWRQKKAKALKAGQPEYPLIHYADFSDYKVIIERGDNWTKAFKPVFQRRDDIRESLQRLYPVRIATAHARPITREDALMLVVETTRLLKAIARSRYGKF